VSALKAAALGAVATLAALAGAFYLAATWGLIPANADARPPRLEKWIATKALNAAINRGAPTGDDPLPLTDANLKAGIKLYAADCAVCHGAQDAKLSDVALGIYQKAPQFAKYGVEYDDDGVLYWIAAHGVRMTAMPSFQGTLTDRQLWQVVLFLKNMDALPPAPQKAWDAVPSAARSARESRNEEVSRERLRARPS
jgi:thiosulfate dehydrogenase